jgi:autophagy-related protein 9
MHDVTSPEMRNDSTLPETAVEDDEDDDDGEVPQSLLIEARHSSKGKHGQAGGILKGSPTHARQPPRGSGGQKLPSGMPPRPSDLPSAADFTLPMPNIAGSSSSNLRSQVGNWSGKRGLDEYERALWNWINVYNLDAFLQEVSIVAYDATVLM